MKPTGISLEEAAKTIGGHFIAKCKELLEGGELEGRKVIVYKRRLLIEKFDIRIDPDFIEDKGHFAYAPGTRFLVAWFPEDDGWDVEKDGPKPVNPARWEIDHTWWQYFEKEGYTGDTESMKLIGEDLATAPSGLLLAFDTEHAEAISHYWNLVLTNVIWQVDVFCGALLNKFGAYGAYAHEGSFTISVESQDKLESNPDMKRMVITMLNVAGLIMTSIRDSGLEKVENVHLATYLMGHMQVSVRYSKADSTFSDGSTMRGANMPPQPLSKEIQRRLGNTKTDGDVVFVNTCRQMTMMLGDNSPMDQVLTQLCPAKFRSKVISFNSMEDLVTMLKSRGRQQQMNHAVATGQRQAPDIFEDAKVEIDDEE